MEVLDKLLFLRYAAPCVDDFVIRGLMSEDYAREILSATQEGKVLENSEKQFDLAHLMCEHTAKKMNLTQIDASTIRTYYLNLHNKLIGIHKPVACSESECKITIEKEAGSNNTSFFRKIDKECVIVHRGYVVDLLEKKELEEILSKSSYLETH